MRTTGRSKAEGCTRPHCSRAAAKPKPPRTVSEHARACLEALSAAGCGGLLSLGGAFALAYYHEYRSTADVDAWWTERAGADERTRVVKVIEQALSRYGAVKTRQWGDVTSVELAVSGKVVFGVQIAQRSAQLEASLPAPWPSGLLIDGLDDLLASKMEALVSRGAPRDFRDVHAVCDAALADRSELWSLWQRRREIAGEAADRRNAALAVRTHLERIERVRPLEKIADLGQREAAGALRAWFKEHFLAGLV